MAIGFEHKLKGKYAIKICGMSDTIIFGFPLVVFCQSLLNFDVFDA